jgi:hydrogenase maturation protein HypF
VTEQTRDLVGQQLARGLNAPMASSMGRLFDAAAAVLGVRNVCAYEGQAAMELEALAGSLEARPLPWIVSPSRDGGWQFDPLPLLAALGDERQRGVPVTELAAAFHESVVEATVALVRHAAAVGDCQTVALGGGCFQNARLLSRLRQRLRETGYEVLLPIQLSPNDGAVSFGQAAVGAALLSAAAPLSTLLVSSFER